MSENTTLEGFEKLERDSERALHICKLYMIFSIGMLLI